MVRGVNSARGSATARGLSAAAFAAILSLAALASASHLPPGGTFTDDDGSVHEGFIEAIAAEGVTQGCAPSLYCPLNSVTRGQMASFLARALDLPPASKDFFPDDAGNVHEDNINRIAEAGITLGFPDGTYKPLLVVNRGQMASFLARGFDLPPASKDFFPDDAGNVHEDNINRIAEAGITLGFPDGTYKPGLDVRRDQMASFIGRAMGLTPHPPPPPTTTTTTGPTTTTSSTSTTTSTTTTTTVPPSPVIVNLPFDLTWDQNEGGLFDDKDGTGTGFTWEDEPSNGTGYIAANLDVLTGGTGHLEITTTSGLALTTENDQDNTLGVGIAPPDKTTEVSTVVEDFPTFGGGASGNFQQAGTWFGNDEDNYIKLVLIERGSGNTGINFFVEAGGAQDNAVTIDVGDVSSSDVTLILTADPAARTAKAEYKIGGGATQNIATFGGIPADFFSADQAGIDPQIGTNTFTGIFASHRNGATFDASFDAFSIRELDAPPPPPGEVSFTEVQHSVSYSPTSMAWGPDNRLYVTSADGTIWKYGFNAAGDITSTDSFSTLVGNLTLGITVDPASTPSNVILWVAHSEGFGGDLDPGVINSSKVTKLTGNNFQTRDDVITGLPRARANHSINSLHFGADGKLYFAIGGHTGAGAPNNAGTEFGTRPEQILSASLNVADVKAGGFDGDCDQGAMGTVNEGNGTAYKGPSLCDVTTFATGLRNTYDFVFHSNGEIYATDNGLGVKGTVPNSATPDCQGIIDYTLPVDPLDPGEQKDLLLRIQQGKYYGHPNTSRDECVFKDGTFQGVGAPADYVAPMYEFPQVSSSVNGIIEYTSDAFCGTMQGDLLTVAFSQGDDLRRLQMNGAGTAITNETVIASGFSNPLTLTQAPGGTIFIGEFRSQQNFDNGYITVLIPEAGCWSGAAAHPVDLLDPGSAVLGSDLYVVGGKNLSNHVNDFRRFNGSSWTTLTAKPGTAVENPAVAATGGKLYVFAGSTSGLSGAIDEAWVYDPGGGWDPIADVPTARGGAAAQVLGGDIWVIGGMDSNGASLDVVEIYDPGSNTWSTGPTLAVKRDNPGAAVLNGYIYVFGGRTRTSGGSTTDLASVERSNGGAWAGRAAMPTARRTVIVGALNGRAQVISGEKTQGGAAVVDANEEYDPTTNAWRTLADIPTPRHGMAGGTIGSEVFLVAGGPDPGTSVSSINEVFTLP